jgi:colanic acid biosynthesis glycosyl transferase WcaI
MVKEIAEHLADNGWQVAVCAGLPHHPRGRLYEGWGWRPWQRSLERNVEVVRTGHIVHESRAIPVRAAVYTTQAIGAALAAAARDSADIVLVYGPPLVGSLLGAAVAMRHRAKLVNVVYDIYPDIAVETGKVRSPLIVGAARLAEGLQYRASDLTIVLSEGFKRQLAGKGVPEDKIAVVPVWLDPDEIRPLDRDNEWRRAHGIPLEKSVVLYAGTIGVVSGAMVVAEAAALLRERDDILFLFVGEGEERPRVEARARELGLSNMMFLPFQPRERLAGMLSSADVCLVTLATGRGRTSVPSKVQGYMAAGRPIVASVDCDSDTAREIESSGAGVVVEPEDPQLLADAIAFASSDRDWRTRCGAASRRVLEEQYARGTVLELYRAALEGLLS